MTPRTRRTVERHLTELVKQAARTPAWARIYPEIHRRIDALLDELAEIVAGETVATPGETAGSADKPAGNLAEKLSRLTRTH